MYYGDPRFDDYLNTAMLLFPDTYTLGEALKVLRYGMPLILQAALLMMDFIFLWFAFWDAYRRIYLMK